MSPFEKMTQEMRDRLAWIKYHKNFSELNTIQRAEIIVAVEDNLEDCHAVTKKLN